MELSIKKIIDPQNITGRLILHCMSDHPDILSEISKNGSCNVVLTINGKECNIENFMNRWQKQVSDMINKEAHKLIHNKLRQLDILVEGVRQKLIDEEFIKPDWVIDE